MGGYLYYVPGAGHDVDYHAAGLDYAFDDRSPTRCPVTRGPDGAAGVVVSCDEPMRVRYVPAEQTWGPVPGTEAWVGYWRDAPPGPGDLERARMLVGHRHRLGDGQEWIIPLARGVLVSGDELLGSLSVIPCTRKLDAGGSWVNGDPLPQYREFGAIAARWFDAVVAANDAGGPVQYDYDEEDDAAAVLGVNYRIGRAEISLRGLFATYTAREVLYLIMDSPTLVEWNKKKQQREASSG